MGDDFRYRIRVQGADAFSESFKVKRVGFNEQHTFFCLFNFIFPAIDGVHIGECLHTCGQFFFYKPKGEAEGASSIRAATKHAQREVFCFC